MPSEGGDHGLFMVGSRLVRVQREGGRYALDPMLDLSRGRRSVPFVARAVAAVGVAVLAVVGLVGCGDGEAAPGLSVTRPPEESASATPSRTPAPTQTPRPSQTPSAEAMEAISGLSTFISDYGYPSDATFAHLRIPKLGVDAQVASRTVGLDGVMPDPEGPAEVLWYDMSAWDGMGGVPGGGGNAVFSGHVDYDWTVSYAGGVRYRGQGVFSQLHQLQVGDIIEVAYAGATLRYAVVSNQQLGAGSADWGSVWSSGGGDAVTLYTCGGTFDASTLEYSDRVVVRAERIE